MAGHVAMSVFDEGDGGLAYDEHFQRRVRLNGHDVIAMDARKTDGSQLLMTLGKFALGTKRDLEEPALVVDVFADKRSGDRTFQIAVDTPTVTPVTTAALVTPIAARPLAM